MVNVLSRVLYTIEQISTEDYDRNLLFYLYHLVFYLLLDCYICLVIFVYLYNNGCTVHANLKTNEIFETTHVHVMCSVVPHTIKGTYNI